MSEESGAFNHFVDDMLLSEDAYLLKGELDLLIMQYLFNSLDLENLNNSDNDLNDSFIAA